MLLVPTRRRLSKLRTFCNSACETKTSCPALIIVDKQDYFDNEEAYKNIEEHLFPNKDWRYVKSNTEGMGEKIRETFEIWKSGTWVAILNDDHVIKTVDWDKRLVSQLDGKNFVTCNDHWRAPIRAAGATVWSMPLIEAVGFPIFPPQIEHLGIDDVWEIIGKNTGCWWVDMSVIVEHHHVYQNPNERVDETHEKVYGKLQNWHGSEAAKRTENALKKWIEEDAKDVLSKIKALQEKDYGQALSVPAGGG